MEQTYDFSGWATRNNVKCLDGRTIKPNAFAGNDGEIVPLVWQHNHKMATSVLGHCMLENCADGVYAYGKFNSTEEGQHAKTLVEEGDVDSLSIWANGLKENQNGDVFHGVIREVSLVLSGANPEARIDHPIIQHCSLDDVEEDAGIMYFSAEPIKCLSHAADKEDKEMADKSTNATDDEKTIGEVVDSMTEEQKTAMYALIAMALSEDNENNAKHSTEGDDDMGYNVFEGENNKEDKKLMHDALNEIVADAKRCGSIKESFLEHSADYGIEDIDWLFPEAQTMNTPPEFISRDMTWVGKIMSTVHTTPFSRIKSLFADITEDEARAKGYIKGKKKKDEVFTLLKRTTTPTTIYKKQKFDRDDIIDIVDFDVIAWIKREMRMMLDEELARAYLIGDGRLSSSDDKINESNIRPVYSDDELYTIRKSVVASADADEDTIAKAAIKAAIKARKDYKGSGTPTFYTTEDVITDMLLLEDGVGRRLYNSVADLATALRVKEIVAVPVMEGVKRTTGEGSTKKEYPLIGIIVNFADYNVGADKGGAVSMFDDFDIDYNQQKYLIETRCSGALVKPYSAIVLELDQNTATAAK